MIIRDLYLKKIQPYIGKDLIKVITGMRRSGKSVILQQIQQYLLSEGVSPEQIFYLNFEQIDNIHLTNFISLHREVMNKMGKYKGKVYLFFDEIQEVANWEKCINSLRLDLDCDIYLTGSNAHLLSGELATYLSGRYVEIVVYPFSFTEFIQLYRSVKPSADTSQCFLEFLELGGMPYLAQLDYNKDSADVYLQGLYDTVELKDIIQRNHIRDGELLSKIMGYLTNNPGTPFTSNSLVKYFKSEGRKVALETISNYLQAAADAFLFYPIPCENIVGKNILRINEKFYLADHGIRRAIFGSNQQVINLILENLLCLELLRRDYKVSFGRIKEREIDFIGTKKGKKIYIQVAYLLASPETIEREFTPLLQVQDNFPKYVVSMDELNFSQKGIQHVSVKNFLLSDEW